MGADSLSDRTARAARWRLAGSAFGAACQLAVGVLLARLLTPSDFGMMALAVVVLGFAQPPADLGIGRAIVQRAWLTERHIRAAFTFSVVLGVVIAATMALAAPLGAFVMSDSRVTSILRLLSAGFALRGAAVVAEALLRRHLDFKRQFFIDTGSYLVGFGGVAVSLALFGFGVWSLVWGSLVQILLASAAQLAAVRHSLRPLLASRELKDLLHFGFGAAVSGWVNYIARNGDYVVVGRWIGAASLGLYSRAYTLMDLPHTYAASATAAVMFPAFSQVQREPARLRRGYLLVTQLTAIVAAPAMGTLAVVAPHLVPVLYGSEWTGVVLPLQILCLAGYFRAQYHLGGILSQSAGRVYSELGRQVVYAALVIGGAVVGSSHGLPGVAVAVSVAIMYMFVATGQLALQITDTPWHVYLRAQVGAIVTAAVTCGVALLVRRALEASQASSAVIALAVIIAAAVPWGVGALWILAHADYELLRARLPSWFAGLVETLRASSWSSSRRASLP